jgi:putative transposase
MSKSNVIELSGREETGDPLTALLRTGARTLIERAVEAELVEFMARFEGRRLEDGRAAVVRNGYQPERAIETGIGPVTVKIPKVRATCGEPVSFRSALVPPYLRKTRSLEGALSWLYLKGVSSGETESGNQHRAGERCCWGSKPVA